MEQALNTHKARDFTIGFFGWLLISSLIVWFSDSFPWRLWMEEIGLRLITVIVIGILIFTKKNWFAYGVMAAVFTNIFIFMLIFSLMGSLVWGLVSLLATAIVISILFFMKRNWFGYGIVVAVFTNALIFSLMDVGWELMSLSLNYGLSSPFFMVGGYY